MTPGSCKVAVLRDSGNFVICDRDNERSRMQIFSRIWRQWHSKQQIFSAVFYISSVSLYQGFLMVGYATVYTMFPVFSLVLDIDIPGKIALTYPELYKDLAKGRSLSYKTFFTWCLISIYQGLF